MHPKQNTLVTMSTTLETKSSVIIATLLEHIEAQVEKFEGLSISLSSIDIEVSEAMAMVAIATEMVFQNLIPIWRRDEEQWIPNIMVSPAKLPKRASAKSKVQQWFSWSIELKEIAMAFDDNPHIRQAVLDLSDAYENVGKTFESKLSTKKPFFSLQLPSRRYELCDRRTANNVMDGLMVGA